MENQQEHKKHSQTSKDAASVNVVEVVVPMIGGKSCLFTYLFSLSIGILDDVDLSALHLLAVDATAQTVVNSHYLKTLCSRSRDACRCKLQLNTIGWTAFPKASCGTYCIGVGTIQWSRVNIVGRCAGGNLDAVSIHVVASDIVGTAAQDFEVVNLPVVVQPHVVCIIAVESDLHFC